MFFQRMVREIQLQLQQDHDLYHHSLVNQSLHFFSGCQNIVAYILFFSGHFVSAVSLGLVSWFIRQSGHFFFESKEYDEINQMTFEEKEAEKVGANLHRKLLMIGGLAAFLTLFFVTPDKLVTFAQMCGYAAEGPFSALIFFSFLVFIFTWVSRSVWLMFNRSLMTGVCWFIKILYDPINDLVRYHDSPLKLMAESQPKRS